MALQLLLLSIVSLFLAPASCGSPSSTSYACDWLLSPSTGRRRRRRRRQQSQHGTPRCAQQPSQTEFNNVINSFHFTSTRAFILCHTAENGGACGYGDTAMAMDLINGGGGGGAHFAVAAAGADFFRDGAGCGACYQASRNPGKLAVRFLYQGGQTDIAAVEIARVVAASNRTTHGHAAQAAPSLWRSHGAAASPEQRLRMGVVARPAAGGPLQLRLVVTPPASAAKWLRRAGEEAARRFRRTGGPGREYDTGIRVTDVALRTCATSCRAGGGDEELR
ncbi:hypothetical protein HU200_066632 [Digitaria exilis]|uniref:Expansin-like EG45 domain-containing protein n=1 Tax=Digitaria exilis TaxID=1010633 RepID=A0A835A021_9POAL|nr:hypothetical protein HU200_066632 [Digitaria exilis]